MTLNKGGFFSPKLIIGLIVICIIFWFVKCRGGQGQQMGMGGASEVVVYTVQPQRVELSTELPGRTSPYLVAEVRPQVNGIVQKRLFREGSDVQAGQQLYQIDLAEYQAAYDSAKAGLSQAQANFTTAELRAKRYKELLADNAVSQQDCDDATAAWKQARAAVEAGKAATEAARISLNYTNVFAPISGRIGKSSVTDGALVAAYQPLALASIQQLDPIYVDVTQSSAELLNLRRNVQSGTVKAANIEQKVRIILEDGSAYPLEGTLQFRDITVDPTTASFGLRAVIPNPDHLLLPGMFVRATIQEGVLEQALLVPQQGIARNPKGEPYALIVDNAGLVQTRPLKLDRAIGNNWLVTSGLNAGDQVIVEGAIKVRPGAPAKIVSAEQAKANPNSAPASK